MLPFCTNLRTLPPAARAVFVVVPAPAATTAPAVSAPNVRRFIPFFFIDPLRFSPIEECGPPSPPSSVGTRGPPRIGGPRASSLFLRHVPEDRHRRGQHAVEVRAQRRRLV